MDETKILEIGAEGGHLIFYKISENSETYYTSALSDKFKTAKALFENYTKSNDPLLWYYPMEISKEIRKELLTILLREYNSFSADHFMNLYAWEEKLDVKFAELKPTGHQTFFITPIIKHERYEYDSHGENPQFIDSVITTYRDNPKYRKKLTGIGSVEGNAFVIRDENSVIRGVISLALYEIEIEIEK